MLLRVPPELFTDWQTFHRAATELRTGAGAQLYQEGLRLIEGNSYEYWRESNMSGHGQYIYPPLFAFLVSLSFLTYSRRVPLASVCGLCGSWNVASLGSRLGL